MIKIDKKFKLNFTDLFNYPKGTEFYVNGKKDMVVVLTTDDKYLQYKLYCGFNFYTELHTVLISNKWVNEYYYVLKED